MREKKWSEKPYRGRTSLDIKEMAGMTNKEALITTIAVIGGLSVLILLMRRK